MHLVFLLFFHKDARQLSSHLLMGIYLVSHQNHPKHFCISCSLILCSSPSPSSNLSSSRLGTKLPFTLKEKINTLIISFHFPFLSTSKLANFFRVNLLFSPDLLFCLLYLSFGIWDLFLGLLCFWWASLVAQMVKRLPTMRETRVRSLGQEDPLEKETATHSSIHAWKIPWTEEPGGLQSMGSQRVGHNWAISLCACVCVCVCVCVLGRMGITNCSFCILLPFCYKLFSPRSSLWWSLVLSMFITECS